MAAGVRQHPFPVTEKRESQQVLLYGHTVTTLPDLFLQGAGFWLAIPWRKKSDNDNLVKVKVRSAYEPSGPSGRSLSRFP